ncbi:MAG: GNAT family N-acetyltransferase [Oscillospiraceae bacterium]|nr:GNAT family N-acetyltransferase [Oscillospiraceae bacterium]
MKIYKTLPDGTEFVEYEDSMATMIADMWNRSGEGWGGQFDGGIYTAERVKAKKASGAFFNVYIALKDGEAIGYCSLDRYYKDEDTAYVHLLNVRPDYHGKGIGKELVLLCVYETIHRKIPRIDIHTWPGNTKAVPLYKKCGFLWEDRTDTTHLSNFVPTVLFTELFQDFFKKADWYHDSNRKIDLKPDGVKTNKFEQYGYSWQKDGENLQVAFEKSGRRIYFVETDDFIIEMTAKNHELAYGLSYPCAFKVTNKTGKDLNISIKGKDDDVIKFNMDYADNVVGEKIYDGAFFVGAITELQDPMRMHPCVLADVTVNGKHVEFGLGIEPKFPIAINIQRQTLIASPSSTEKAYINIKNSLPSDGVISFKLPENDLVRFEQSKYELNLTKDKDAMIDVHILVKNCGYINLPIEFEITLSDGTKTTATYPLHIVCQGMEGQFSFETDDHIGVANGLWYLQMDKKDNGVSYNRITPTGDAYFAIAQLGKPYDEEFDLMKPSDVRVTNSGAFTRFEADFVSRAFPGAVLTEIYEFDAAGTIKKCHRITNKGTTAQTLQLMSTFGTKIGPKPVFHYNGDFHEVSDKMNYGFDTLEYDKIDEPWIFDECYGNPSGLYWSPKYKPSFKWGNWLIFEYNTGNLEPEQSFETEPIVYMCGVFKNFKDFRNYVLGLQSDNVPIPKNHLEIIANKHNPVVSEKNINLSIKNNRQNIHEGSVTVSSCDNLFARQEQKNPKEKVQEENLFEVSLSQEKTGVHLADISFNLMGFEQENQRVLLISDKSTPKTIEEDGVLTLINGEMQFSLSPSFSNSIHSLKYDKNEWLFSQYPSRDPFSWWNPFVGGIVSNLEKMGSSLIVRENMTASFVSETDTLGNVWFGIRSDVEINEFDLYKGMKLSSYYLTLPGVPILCQFTKAHNNTGRFIDIKVNTELFLSGKENMTDIYVEFEADYKTKYKIQTGIGDDEYWYDYLAKVTHVGNNPRSESIYIYKNSVRDRGSHYLHHDLNTAGCYFEMRGRTPNTSTYTTKPIFCILTEKELTIDSLCDLNRIEF